MSRRKKNTSSRNRRPRSDETTVTARKSGRRTGARSKGKGKPPQRSFLRRAVRFAALCTVWGLIAASLVIGYFAFTLPDLDTIEKSTRRPSITLLDRSGARIANYGNLHGERLSPRNLPPHLRQAVIAIEDRSFYDHWGVDVWGMARALAVNLTRGRIRQGGSTITQQLAKNIFLTHQRSIKRKIQETLLAFWLEQRFTKDEILALYLNRVYLGKGTYGADAAAQLYFGVSAQNLNLYQSALLAGLLKAPSRINPLNDVGRAQRRAEVVLAAMVDAGFITESEVAEAKRNRGIILQPRRNLMTRYYTDWVLERASNRVNFTEQDLIVVTTLSASLQQMAEESAAAHVPRRHGGPQVALVAMAPNGAVRAMIGGRDYGESQFNRAVMARRQPGSAFKIFVFLAAIEAGFSPTDKILDAPVRVGKWRPRNYNNRYFGSVTLREALTRSLNSVAVRLAERVGRKRVIRLAREMGVASDLADQPSLALGSSEVTVMELTRAYAVLANRGRTVEPHAILEIRTASGEILYRRRDWRAPRVVERDHVQRMNDMLRAVIGWGTGRAAQIGRPAAGKTGTTQNSRDGWFVGYTPQLVTGVWIGRDDSRTVKGLTGGGLPAKLWARFMRQAHAGRRMVGLPGVSN